MKQPEAVFLLGTRCPHCPSVLASLSELIKSGELSRLDIVNLENNPEIAQQYSVRSVPWVRIGQYELSGIQTIEAFRQRIEWSLSADKMQGTFDKMLSQGKAPQVAEMIRKDPDLMGVLIKLLSDPATILSSRIGIGYVMEDHSGTQTIQQQIPILGELLSAKDARIRIDAAYYLGLTESAEALTWLEKFRNDQDEEMKTEVNDSFEQLQNSFS